MNNEIKLMLNIIKDVSEHKEGSRNGLMILSCKDYKTLLDYITKLQQENEKEKQFVKDCGFENAQQLALDYIGVRQENERLKDSINWWKDRFFGQQEYDDSHRITAIEYKKRIEKAIELINVRYKEQKQYDKRLKDLLNILQGESKGE